MLSTSCSRLSKKFPGISKKVAQTLLKKQSKRVFCDESCSKVARKHKTFFASMLKYENCTTKVRFLSIFSQFCSVDQRC